MVFCNICAKIFLGEIMKKFKMNFTKTIYALLWLVAVLTIAGAVFDFLVVLEVGSLRNTSIGISVSAMVSCLAVCAASLSLIFGCEYHFKNDRFYVCYGFFSMYFENKNFTEIKHNLDTDEVFLIFNDVNSKIPEKLGVVKANVKKDEIDEFLKVAKAELPKTLYTTFTKKDLEN